MSQTFAILPMNLDDVSEAAALQPLAFPPPFPAKFHWRPEHMAAHVRLFPEGQFIALADGQVVGSCTNCIVSEAVWQRHASWMDTIGGPNMEFHHPLGTTLYGVDISVHPSFRKLGIGRAFYQSRFDLVQKLGLKRYSTACRLPDYQSHSDAYSKEAYATAVFRGEIFDRTLTPFSRFGMQFIGIIEGYMEDKESGNAAALWEWKP